MPYTDDEIRVSIEFEMGNRFLIGVFEPWLASHNEAIRADEREQAAQRVAALRVPSLARDFNGNPFPSMIELGTAIRAARGEDSSHE